jgi:hypothetical protein
VLNERRKKTIVLEGAGGVGESAMNGGIQDGRRGRGNSFHQFRRNHFSAPGFHAGTRPRHGLQFHKRIQS